MNEALQFVVEHGYLLLFAFVLIEQIGFPLPSVPVLLAGGALVSTGRLELLPATAAVLAGSVAADLFWYELGRRRGKRVLGFLCRIAIEADSCVRRTETVFRRYGASTLLISKFLPGLNTAAPPLAGAVGMSPVRFVLFTAGGALIWAGAFGGLGYVFAAQLERAAQYAVTAGNVMAGLSVLGGPVAYIGWKYVERRRFLRELNMARISPQEAWQRMSAGEDILFIDLRSRLDIWADGYSLPGALRMDQVELDLRHHEIPRDREIVLGCT